MEIPDFRKKEVRDRYRNDDWMAKHLDPKKIFPDDQDTSITCDFASCCKELIPFVLLVRSALDGIKVYDAVKKENRIVIIEKVKEVRTKLSEIQSAYKRARKIADAYPQSQGGEALLEKLELGEEEKIMDTVSLLAELDDFLINA
ncbi:MAG: hypothetical protein J6S53_10295 [Lentisphaeria bacterium]|nr:hypothetical protein [Lentisphaeria bacterium]